MHSTIQRVTLRWPYLNNTARNSGVVSAAVLSSVAIPGPIADGPVVTATVDDDLAIGWNADGSARLAPETVAQKIELKRQGQGPIRAIAIAPDSAIKSCDIWLAGDGGEFQKHRCSPGNPVLAAVNDAQDYALVSALAAIPGINANPIGAGTSKGFDATIPGSDSDDNPIMAFPLRLEIWHGEIPPLRAVERSEYCGEAIGSFTYDDAEPVKPTTRLYYVCTDGRHRLGITLACFAIGAPPANGTQMATIECYAVEARRALAADSDPYLDPNSLSQMPLDDTGATSLTATYESGGDINIQFDGIAPTILMIRITAPAGQVSDAGFSVKWRAED
jgi:hypothetical protein